MSYKFADIPYCVGLTALLKGVGVWMSLEGY